MLSLWIAFFFCPILGATRYSDENMPMKICFATNNPNKIAEVAKILGEEFDIMSLAQVGCHEELPETHDTLEGNSLQKAQYVHEHYGVNCFADDSGLEVAALGGAPGVYSAMYAGPERSDQANIKLLLKNLAGEPNRNAQFRTVATVVLEGVATQFEGVAKGAITLAPKGNHGFGYDPVFVPIGHNQTFAQMGMAEKNHISHRARAVAKLTDYLLNKQHKNR